MATKEIQPKPGYKLTEIGDIPEEWEVVRLRDIAVKFISGGTPSTSRPEYWNGSVPWMRSASINNRFVDSGEKYITEEGLKNSATNVVPKGNVLIATRVCIGNVAINRIDVAISQDLTGVLLQEHKAFPEYIYWSLKTAEHRIKSLIQGSTIKGVLREDLQKLELPLPPLPEQQRIAEILSTVDEAIQKTDEIIHKTQQLKKGLMQQLLTRGIGHTKFKLTEIGDIPEEWEVVRLGDICEVVGGGTPSTTAKEYWGGTIPFVIPTDITNLEGNFLEKTENYITELGLKDSSAKLISEGAVLLTSRATIGFCAINKVPVSTNQGFASVICKDRIHNQFLYYYLRLIKNKLLSLASGSTFKEISKASFRKLQLPLPPLPEQQKIAEILSTVDVKIESERHRKQKLQELKKGLMQVLLTGKVRVKAG